MIIHNATIHSPIERFATALHIDNGIIVWMGEEDTAEFRARAHPEATVTDAGGNLLTPAFHNAYAASGTPFGERGITAAHVPVGGEADLTALAPRIDATGIFAEAPGAGPGIHLLPSGAKSGEMRAFLHAARPPGIIPALSLDTAADVREFLLIAAEDSKGRVYLNSALAVAAQELAGWSVVVVLDGDLNLPLAGLARGGIPFAFGGPLSPWDAITRALFDGPEPITARAGFAALTRGAWRLTPGQLEPRGVLRVGAPADLALWEVEALAVQTPDDRASAWSTDQRAGTPLLPALGAGETPPRLTTLIRRGAHA